MPRSLPIVALIALAASAPAQCLDMSTPFAPAGTADHENGYASVLSLVAHDDGSGPALWLSGRFTGVGRVQAAGVARWNGTEFAAVDAGLDGNVYELHRADLGAGPRMYAAGTQIGAQMLRAWDGSTWAAVPGMDDPVLDLVAFDFGTGLQLVAAVSDPGGAVVQTQLGGLFWTPLGPGPNNQVNALAVYDDGAGPALYAAGAFSSATSGGAPVRGVARWFNGAGWVEVGGGITLANGSAAIGYDLATFDDGTGAKLVVAGTFTHAGASPIRGVALWDGATWSPLGAGVDGTVREVESVALASGPKLVLHGAFAHAGGAPAATPVVTDGATWTSLGGAFGGALTNPVVETFASFDDGAGPALFAGGNFATAGGVVASDVARWDESAWSALGVPGSVTGAVRALARHDDGSGTALYAGGALYTAGDRIVRQVARFDGAAWSPVGPVTSDDDPIEALLSTDVGQGSRLYAAGRFHSIAGTTAESIAAWDGVAWTPLAGGGLSFGTGSPIAARVYALAAFDEAGTRALYAAGDFTHAGGSPANGIARWTPAGGWSNASAGLGQGHRLALAVFDDGTGPALYAGGGFPEHVARWNGASWQGLPQAPSGGGGWVHALQAYDDGVAPRLFVGGLYSSVGGVSTFGIAAWTGGAWQTFGAGATGLAQSQVVALHVLDDGDGAGARLFAGGRFASIGGVPAASIAAFDGAQWSSVGGVGGGPAPGWITTVQSLASFDDGEGPALYAGGDFTLTNLAAAVAIARYGRHGASGCEPTTGASVCDGSGAFAACPCGNFGLAGHGCGNSANAAGAALTARGAANVGIDGVTLDVAGTPPASPVLFFQGTSVPGAGLGVVFGDGVRCVSGAQVRLATRSAAGGAASFGAAIPGDPSVSSAGGVAAASARLYQVWYRNAAPAYCTGATFNLSNALRIVWAE